VRRIFALGAFVTFALSALVIVSARAQEPQVDVTAGCIGVDHTEPYEDPNTGVTIEAFSIIPIGASVDGAPVGARFVVRLRTPDGQILVIEGVVGEDGRVAGAGGIFTFGPYATQGPIVISFTDPTTGEQRRVRIDPTTVVPGGVFVVGPEEVACNVADLPPGTVLVVTSPSPVTQTPSPVTGTGSPVTGTISPPAVSTGGGGSPVIWIVVIGGGVVLVVIGTVMVSTGGRGGLVIVAPPNTYRTKEGGGMGTREKPPKKPPDPRVFDPKKEPFPQDDGIPWILEWKLDALIWNQFAMFKEMSVIGTILAFGLGAILGLLAAILAAIVSGFSLLAGLLAGIFALLAFFVIQLVVPIVMERNREKVRRLLDKTPPMPEEEGEEGGPSLAEVYDRATGLMKEREPETKVCPFCATEIAVAAVRCPNCTSQLEGGP